METPAKRFHEALKSKKWNTPDHHKYLGSVQSTAELYEIIKKHFDNINSSYIYPACIECLPTLRIETKNHYYYVSLEVLCVKNNIESIIAVGEAIEQSFSLNIKINNFYF